MERIEVKCPHCGNDFKIKTGKLSGFCTKCGESISIDKKSGSAQIPIVNSEIIQNTQTVSEKTYTRRSSNNSLTSLLLGLIVIISAFFNYSYTNLNAEKSVELFGYELISQKYDIIEGELTFLHGVKNGILVMGKTLADVFIIGAVDYISGFDFGLIGNALWLLFGWIWTFTKAFLFAIPKYFVSLYNLFIAGELAWYYVGYVISTLFTWVLIKAED